MQVKKVLLQNGQPITYASRALTPAETRYSQIEKELLAQIFGLERNHEYAYGRHMVLWTDHKPLVSISRKPLANSPKRLQRLLLRLQRYDVDIRYKPGREMYLADTLSRAYLKTSNRSAIEEEVESVHMIDNVSITHNTFTLIKAATADDESLQTVKRYILSGWPEHKRHLSTIAKVYCSLRDELSYQEGIIFRGERCVVPKSARPRIRERLHKAHMGIQSTLRRARDTVYWPGMTKDLTDYISNCETCNTYQAAHPKEPLISHPIPSYPWEKIGIDLFTLDNNDYLHCGLLLGLF